MPHLEDENIAFVQRWVGNSRDWLKSFLATAPALPQIVAAVVMGSAVRDRGHRRSDFDILIVYQGDRPAVKSPMEVDVRFALLDQLSDLVAQGHEIVCWALKFGTSLYDRENRWKQLENAWADRIPLPSASEAGSRAIQTLKRARDMLDVDDDSAADDLILSTLTQFAREHLINALVFPASRPELPDQLRALNPKDQLATLLDSAMFGDVAAKDLLCALDAYLFAQRPLVHG